MTVSRIISVVAMTAFASFGAQAGDLYGAGFDTQAPSTLARSSVKAQAADAVMQFKNYDNPVFAPRTASALERSTVRSQAVAANRTGTIATGDRS